MAETSADGVNGPLPGRCGYFVERKKRYCKMIVAERKTFCGEHANADKNAKEDDVKRIPCPLDPKHTVFENKLEKHLKKCNSREKPKPVYYVKDINAGLEEDPHTSKEQITLSSHSKEELGAFIKKLKHAAAGLNHKHEQKILSHSALQETLNDPKNGDFAFKHLKQQASLLGNMEALGLLGPDRCFVEFGAGRGKLSHWVDIALQGSRNIHFLLVERATTRFKVDGKHKSSQSVFERLHVDIQHLCLSKVPLLIKEKMPVVGIGKHLCGAATDLALRCLLDRSSEEVTDREPPRKRLKSDPAHTETGVDEGQPASETVAEKRLKVAGISIALCCHHRCDWKHYVGREFFRSLGLGPQEFGVFQRMSSWATCGMRKPASDAAMPEGSNDEQEEDFEEHDQDGDTLPDNLEGMPAVEERETVGRLCKLLIDQGRIYYLQQKGYAATLQYYTSPSISLENVLLTAVPAKG
ncbi:tRNA:m(4)X modification enzyme TRM13 homolog [Polyodon spathula]|uniref:tRNA:m(4)X modification enzyme TRM13 homolog n=1 Tax=Polyodon spathula TaxID=7913 RepID=UPI001B7DCCB9|nr:tRNA:m(4)X modification enzyme TRM13 homolog [Polyodon spathula]